MRTELETVLLKVKKANIRLWLDPESETLRFEAPKGAMSAELKSEIVALKPEIISFLKQAEQQANQGDQKIKARAKGASVPLSFAQQRLWFLYKMEGKSATYNIPACRRLTGKLDFEAFEKALNVLVARHETLRTNFQVIGDEAQQIIAPHLDVKIKVHDLSNIASKDQDTEKERLVREEIEYAFDLENEPLIRLSLIKQGNEDCILTLVIHHIISDGWSLEILIRELTTVYEQLLDKQEVQLPSLEVQYGDFSIWQRQWASSGGLKQQLDFWEEQLSGMPQLLRLPYDRTRPPVQTYRGGLEFFTIPKDLRLKLETICKQQNASLYMGLCAALSCLIHKYMGIDDVVIGTHTAGRTRKEQEGLIGFFINTLPLRLDLSGDPDFREILNRSQKSALATFSHQDVPFEKLVDIVQPDRDMSYAPLVQVMCVLQNMPIADGNMAGVNVETIELDRDTSKFDLSLLMEDANGDLKSEFEFNRDLFDPPTIARFAGHFVNLLENLVADLDKPVSQIEYLGRVERKTLLDDFSNARTTRATGHIAGSIVSKFEDMVLSAPKALALSDAKDQYSYLNLNKKANQLADKLLQKGLKSQDVVAIAMDNSADAIVGLLGVLKAGGCYLPLDPHQGQERIDYILKDSAAKFVLSSQIETTLECLTLNDLSDYGQGAPDVDIDGHDLAYIIYTSGSTGQPKGVMIEHHSVLDLVNGLNAKVYKKIKGRVNVALLASIAFDASVQQIFAALLQGHHLKVADKSLKKDGAALVAWMRDQYITLSDATPTLLVLLQAANLGQSDEKTLRYLLVGGEALSSKFAQNFTNSNINLVNVYGPTECCVDATSYEVNTNEAKSSLSGTVSIGRPLGVNRAYILDKELKPVPIGVEGELYISGAGLFRGYVNLDEKTTATRLENPFYDIGDDRVFKQIYKTGDLCHWLPCGNIAFVGRNDDQVKVRGYRIELGEIESKLLSHPAVNEAVVLLKEETLRAYVTLSSEMDVSEVRSFLQAKLPDYMVPAQFFELDELPKNNSAKIDRKALSQIQESSTQLSQGTEFITPRSDKEKVVSKIFCDILKLDQVSVLDNFFYLGGDSIKALQIVARLHQNGYQLEMRDLFKYPTIEGVARQLKQTAHEVNIPTPDRLSGDVPLTAIQQWYFDTYQEDCNLHFNQSVLLKSSEKLESERTRNLLKRVFENHDAFYLKFTRENNCVRQFYDQCRFGFHEFDLSHDHEIDLRLCEETEKLQAQTDMEGETIQVGLFHLEDSDYLFIAIHHLVVDAVSWRTLVEELEMIWGNDQAELVQHPQHFGQWAKENRGYGEHEALRHLDYWKDVETRKIAKPAFEFDPDILSTHGDCETETVTLSKEETRLLLGEVHEAYNTKMDDVLLAALALTMGKEQRIMLESHGREELTGCTPIGANVGWLTSMYPVILESFAGESLVSLIKRLKEQRRAIPNAGMDYGILKYMAKRLPFSDSVEGLISFNYLGQFDTTEKSGVFELSDKKVGANISPKALQPFALEIICVVMADQLEITFSYSTKQFDKTYIKQMLELYFACLKKVVRQGCESKVRELTPADIDYDGFDQNALDQFVERRKIAFN